VSHRVRELVERQARLQQRCAAERAAVAREIAAIESRFAGVDRLANVASRTLLHPLVIVGGIVALFTIGRQRGMRLVGRVFLITTALRRLLGAVRILQGMSNTNF
jgi:hypothetical protein